MAESERMMTTTDPLEGLEIKAYFAGTVEAAMEQATQELGPDALLLNSRPAPPEARHLGEFEVVFAASPAVRQAAPKPGAGPAGPDFPGRQPGWDLLCRELRDLRTQVRQMRQAVSENQILQGPAELADILDMLLEAEIEPSLAREVVDRVRRQLFGGAMTEISRSTRPPARTVGALDPEAVRRQLTEELENLVQVDADLAAQGDRARIVALIGPPGAGKTTTLIKLAVTCGLTTRRSVQLLSMDTCRIGAVEQLRAYAGILGVGCQTLETTRALEQAILENRGKSLILIDTPGFSSSNLEDGTELARWLAAHREVDTHLVLPASTRRADLVRILEDFAIFSPAKLIFTRLDETDAWGSILSLVVSSGRPLSYLSFGQMIPEDLEPASKSRVVTGILREPAQRAWSAA